ncbi:MAG: hypothetical protein A2283_11960 [Lentisphaerae bacterium RIFOXYA12_FULL_48_11]|nr:MAG: hypothetical protein A2283_11960 [Lentisphaerae bacterium RIFOXYA12_FULL_48_11]
MPFDRTHAFANQCAVARGNILLYPVWWLMALFSRRADARCRIYESWFQFFGNAIVGGHVMLGPHAWCVNEMHDPERIVLEDDVICRGLLRVESFGDGRIVIREHVYIGDDVLISSACRVEIKADTLIAHGVQILDNDAHPLDVDERVGQWRQEDKGGRFRGASAPVLVEARAWICTNAIVLKGVCIGEGSIVAAGSVVTSDIPSGVLAGGNPARVLRRLSPGETR